MIDLESMDFTWPSPAYIVGAVVFGIIGFVAWRYGRKQAQPATKWLGVALMFYPYLVSDTWLLYLIGVALCAAIFWYRRS
jgi:MFS family permease